MNISVGMLWITTMAEPKFARFFVEWRTTQNKTANNYLIEIKM
jgi:hypothetical protein